MKKSLLALVAAALVLALILFLTKKSETAQGQLVFALDSMQMDQAAQIHLAKAPDTALLESKDGKWLTAKDAFPVDTAKIHKLLRTLYQLQTQEVVSRNPERAAEYGLDTANAKHVAWKDKGGKEIAKVVIGKTSGADYNSTYWKYEDKPEVYRTSGNFTWDILTRNDDWKDKKLFGFKNTDIQFIQVTWKDSLGMPYSYRIEAVNDSTWKMLEPQVNPVKRDLAQEIANSFPDITLDDFITAMDTNKAKAQLDSPTVAIRVTLKDGKTHEMKAGKSFEGFTYALHPTRPDTIKVSNWRFEKFKKKPFELIEPVKDTAKVDSLATKTTSPASVPALAVPALKKP